MFLEFLEIQCEIFFLRISNFSFYLCSFPQLKQLSFLRESCVHDFKLESDFYILKQVFLNLTVASG